MYALGFRFFFFLADLFSNAQGSLEIPGLGLRVEQGTWGDLTGGTGILVRTASSAGGTSFFEYAGFRV